MPPKPPAPVDWLARRVGGVIDFRLPGDPHDIPSAVFAQRTAEYLSQLRRSIKAPYNPPAFPTAPATKPEQNQAPDESRPAKSQADKSPILPQQSSFL